MKATPTFNTLDEAWAWLDEHVGDPCVDNYRFAYIDDVDAMTKYQEKQEAGCCGSCDVTIIVDGKVATIGCNYGH